jgi:PKD repeat protein
MKKYFRLTSLFFSGLVFFIACKKDTPAPTASITKTITGNIVMLNAVTTDADQFLWNFGDGSEVSSEQNPTHTYVEYGKNYTVTLTVTGGGGEATATTVITIPLMTKMEMLTGGASATTGKKWRMSSSTEAFRAAPDDISKATQTFPAGMLTNLGMGQVYTDEYIFFHDGKLTINPKGGGAFAGLAYCVVNSILNVPTATGGGMGLTYATPYIPSANATFTLNEGKALTVAVTADGIKTNNVIYPNSTTLSFTNNGFFGLMDFMSECVIQDITKDKMKVAFFFSTVSPTKLQVGKATDVLIFSFEVVP